MPIDERVIVVKQGGDGKLALLIAGLGGIAAAVWWFFHRGGGGSSAGANLPVRLTGAGFFLGDVQSTPESIVTLAHNQSKMIDLVVTGDATEGNLTLIKSLAAAQGVILNIAGPSQLKVGGYYRLGNS